MEENHLFDSWKKGDEKAFDMLFRNYYKQLCYIAIKVTGNSTDAEDIVQELFSEIYQNRSKLRIKSSFKNYLLSALYYKCSRFLKKKNKVNFTGLNEITTPPDTTPAPSEILENYELEIKVYEAIDSLPEKCKEIFRLSRFENMKYKDIAKSLGISIKTVETQMSIALKRLGEVVNKYLYFLVLGLLDMLTY